MLEEEIPKDCAICGPRTNHMFCHVCEHRPPQTYVLGFCFSLDESEVALIQKSRPKWQAGLFNGVGGKVEFSESPEHAMVREFEEETGVKTVESEWRLVVVLEGEDFEVHVFDRRADLSGLQTVTDEPVVTFGVRTIMDLPVVSNLPWLIAMCLDQDSARFCPVWITYRNP